MEVLYYNFGIPFFLTGQFPPAEPALVPYCK